jgi:hypothetical protein
MPFKSFTSAHDVDRHIRNTRRGFGSEIVPNPVDVALGICRPDNKRSRLSVPLMGAGDDILDI